MTSKAKKPWIAPRLHAVALGDAYDPASGLSKEAWDRAIDMLAQADRAKKSRRLSAGRLVQ